MYLLILLICWKTAKALNRRPTQEIRDIPIYFRKYKLLLGRYKTFFLNSKNIYRRDRPKLE